MADIFEVTGDFGGINKIKKINKTSSAGSATLEDTSLARLTSELIICFRIRWGGTPHIPIWDIWSDVQTRVGTPHKILRCLRSRRGGDTIHSI